MSEQAPNLHREQMETAIDQARLATQASGNYSKSNDAGTTFEDMRISNYTHNERGANFDTAKIETRDDGALYRVDAKVYKDTPLGGRIEYHAYDRQDRLASNSRGDLSARAVNITRRDSEGRIVSERRIDKPETVQKFIGKIAAQVERRAEANTGQKAA